MNVIRPMRGPLRYPVTFPLVVVLLVVSVLAPTACVPRVPESASRTAKLPERKPTGAEKFAKATDELTGALALAASKLESGSKATTEVAAIAEFADALPGLDKGVRADFAKTRKILAKVDSAEKDAIQAKVEKQYTKRLKTLKSKLAKIEDADSRKATATAVASLTSWMDRITPEEPHQPLGTELPHRIVDYDAGPPTLGTQIAPAYAPNLPDSEPSTLPVTPTDADLAETIEVQFTDDISSLVTSLGADPVKMYEYVRNTIDFEPYYGSRKGANETLWELAGNDMDQASLLIALYRKAGIPARYVSGVVDVPIDKAMNWVGVEVPEAAAKLFASAGTPTTSLVSGGKVKALRIEHTWIEAYVPYEDYRGAGEGTGEKLWVPLDPSFKEYTRISGTALQPLAARFADQLSDAAGRASVSSSGTVSSLSMEELASVCASASANATAFVEAHPDMSVEDILGGAYVRKSRVASLPAALPFSGQPLSEHACVLEKAKERIEIRLADAPVVSMTVVEALRCRIDLGFSYADSEDEEIARASSSASGLPTYLIHGRPTVFVDDEPVSSGESQDLGAAIGYSTTLVTGGDRRTYANSTILGSWHALGLGVGRLARGSLQSTRKDVDALLATFSVDSDAIASRDVRGVMSHLLHLPVSAYFGELSSTGRVVSTSSDCVVVPMTSFGTSGYRQEVQAVLGISATMLLRGLFLDVDAARVGIAPKDRDADPRVVASMLGILSSELESAIWRQFYPGAKDVVSATVALRRAVNSGIPLVVVNSENQEEALRGLQLDSRVVGSIRDAVRAGMSVVCPSRPVTVGSWTGNAWIVEDRDTGSVACMIAGSSAIGGSEMGIGIGTEDALPFLIGYLLDHLFILIGPILVAAGITASAIITTLALVPSIVLSIAGCVDFLLWLNKRNLSPEAKGVYAGMAATHLIASLGASCYLAHISVVAPSPTAKMAAVIGAHYVNLVTSLMFVGLFPIFVEFDTLLGEKLRD